MRKLDYFWMTKKEWYHQRENGTFVLNDDAPKEAKESYHHYLEQRKHASESIKNGETMD